MRRHECYCVPLVLDEVRGREVPRATELFRMDEGRVGAFDRFGERDVLDLWPAFPASDLRAKAEQFVLIRELYGSIDRGQAGGSRYRGAERALLYLPFASIPLPAQVGQSLIRSPSSTAALRNLRDSSPR